MKKLWVKFLKDHTQGEGDDVQEFKKGQQIELSEDLANSLVLVKMAEVVNAPEKDDVITKAIESIQVTVEETVTKALSSGMSKVSKDFKDSNEKLFAKAVDHKAEGLMGFQDEGHFVEDLMKACRPQGAEQTEVFKKAQEMLVQKAPQGQNTQDDTEGGFLIPTEIENRIWQFVTAEDSFIGKSDQRFTSGNSLKYNTFPETSRKSGFRHAGAIAYYQKEADAYTKSTLKWGQQRLELHKLAALFYATDEEIEDAAVALGPIFARQAGKAIRWRANYSFFHGTGVGEPAGFLNSNSIIEQPLEDTGNGEGTILHKNINGMYHKLHPTLRFGAAWYVHPNLEENLEYISFNDDATNKRPIYMPAGGLKDSPYGTLKGLPVIPTEFMFDFGQRGDISLVNWSQYATLQKRGRGIRSASSIHVRFLHDETAFKFNFRIDGKPNWSAPLEDLHGSGQRSWAVTLASRSTEGTSSGI